MNLVVPAERARAFLDLSQRTKLRVTGADRLRFLNGQVSNDLRKATESCALRACVLSAKGRIQADIFVVVEGESFLLDAAAELRETLPARLERYIIADDVQVEDVTEQFALLHSLGEENELPIDTAKAVKAERLGQPGTDFWLPMAERETAVRNLATRLPAFDEAMYETRRIELGLPRWGAELTEEIIPNEANLEASAIDYAKGCYIGQEVISRIKMSGQTNKRLCGLMAESNAPLQAGMQLWTRSAEPKEVGWLTSVTRSVRLGKTIALGFVKRGFQDAGTHLAARDAEAGTEAWLAIVPLPFG